MRCNNCGWENPDTNTRCEKCNAPLSGGASNQPAYAPQPAAPVLNKTVSEAVVFPEAGAPAANICPQCGYPMRAGVDICPNCGHGATAREAQAFQAPQPQAQVHQQPRAAQGTVNPWVQVAPQTKCTLTPVKQDSEAEAPAPQLFKGDSHELNRANLDAENMTITSKVQAVLSCEDGQWFIEDKSSQHTTFILANKKTALQDGDVILMGNRQFIFKAE